MTEFTEIPVIRLGTRPDAEIAAEFRAAYGTTGFGYIEDHGIDPQLIEDLFDASARFHALPLEQKMAVAAGKTHRGYIPINSSTDVNSTLADVTKPNQSASFMMMREDAQADAGIYLSGPNRWPELAGFREALEAYDTAMRQLGRRLMSIALQAADVTNTSVLSAFDTPTTWLRLLHYPPQPERSPEDLYGSAPHTDFGCLTLLVQDDVGGLQVKTPAGNWVDVPRREGTFVVNVGDMLHRMSNGKLLSTPHRVINRSGRERYSCPFFYDPHVNTVIEPLPGTGTPKFPPLKFADFLRSELEAAYDAHKPAAN
ncbi:2-oxoglutarate-dependent ethylene/succinate-forming enzyme [Falsiruegeria litorea R37]|uniref:2-oxoglutarate-dependent ethylene/succinate-forming enzyme n=1 Tax=Falsiruegeria litorea R37 TaxID=1200284 RepID=A0A1Y5S861_9RHOB|nr:2OG-Fe(II) oxygenase family protein [Falsiruegeria litorea]SLN34651.1 2-oxoglutarate-dependent ethylene/succinate-forming enzyme [Falsiruegeria litorea R37]